MASARKHPASMSCSNGQYSILSNLYPCTLRYNNTVFNSSGQLYQYRKSSALGQHEVAANVTRARTPYEAMKEGKAAKASDQWTASTGREIMVNAVVLKYQQCLCSETTCSVTKESVL